jgi:hypothetical protein
MTLLNKLKNEQNRQLQIQAQLAEQSYRAFNGVKQSRENERSGELRKKMNDDLPASSLTKTMIVFVCVYKYTCVCVCVCVCVRVCTYTYAYAYR